MNEFLEEFSKEPTNVYALAFVLFWILVYVFVRKPALLWLDNQIAAISSELTKAQELRAEAEAALTDCKTKQAQAEEEARMILKMAQEQAEAMRKKADDDLATMVARQKHLATERIRLAQEKAVDTVRAEAIRLGMDMARQALSKDLSDADKLRLFEHALEDVPAIDMARLKKN